MTLSWSDGNALLAQLGDERHLKGEGGRVRLERQARGWSQERLAEEMAKVGCPIHQSAISKIESPARGARGVALEELIAFSKVFGIPVGELILPADIMAVIGGYRDLADGPQVAREAVSAAIRYEQLLDRLADFATTSPAVRDHLDAIHARHITDADPTDSFESVFAINLQERLAKQPKSAKRKARR